VIIRMSKLKPDFSKRCFFYIL